MQHTIRICITYRALCPLYQVGYLYAHSFVSHNLCKYIYINPGRTTTRFNDFHKDHPKIFSPRSGKTFHLNRSAIGQRVINQASEVYVLWVVNKKLSGFMPRRWMVDRINPTVPQGADRRQRVSRMFENIVAPHTTGGWEGEKAGGSL